MYEQESERISSRVKAVLKSKCRKGEFKGSVAPYGYHIQDGKLFINEDSSPKVVRYIFNAYLAGDGFDKIAKTLFEQGTPTPSQVAKKSNASAIWHGSTIRKILENPHYIGDLVQGRETSISVTVKKRKSLSTDSYIIIKNTHDAIITRETFDAAQQLIKSRKIIRPPPNKHLFSNILFCSDCGSGMHYKANKKGYVCGAYDKRGKSCCTSHIVREAELKDAILADINMLIEQLNQQNSSEKVQRYIKKQEIQLKKNTKAFTNEIQTLNKRKNTALEFLLDKTLSKEEYLSQTAFISQKVTELETDLVKISSILGSLNQDNVLVEIKKSQNVCPLTNLLLRFYINSLKKLRLLKMNQRESTIGSRFPLLIYNFFNDTQHSTWVVSGNISTGCTFSTL